jgi:hypothetical protein
LGEDPACISLGYIVIRLPPLECHGLGPLRLNPTDQLINKKAAEAVRPTPLLHSSFLCRRRQISKITGMIIGRRPVVF